jgi:glycosyltransferase involved in cell wall biosynthesis
MFDYFFYIGNQNKKLYKYYGVEDEKLIFTPYAVDNERLQYEYLMYKDKKENLKKELGLPPDKVIILASGKYIPQKKHKDLLEAFRLINFESAALVFLGEGKLREEMESYIQKHNLKYVFLTGFKNQTEVGKYFAAADIFVLTSGIGETWGLVVNEAMNFALPIISSNAAGCIDDLIEHGKNGFIYENGNIEELSFYLNYLLIDKEFRNNAGMESLKKIEEYSYGKITEQILKYAY